MNKKTFTPALSAHTFDYTITPRSSHLSHVAVTVPHTLTTLIKDHITRTYSQYSIVPGISCNHLPLSYTEQYFTTEIIQDTKKFILDHFISEGLLTFLAKKHIIISNWPRLLSTTQDVSKDLIYTFAISLAPQLVISSWNRHSFNPPKRKNYTDLDAQVDGFIESIITPDDSDTAQSVTHGDWVQFSTTLQTPHTKSPLKASSSYWIHIAQEHVPAALSQVFIDKKVGQQFTIPATTFTNAPAEHTCTGYEFIVKIDAIIQEQHFTKDTLCACFKVKNHQALHDKLIEIFSFRNDISLRRAIIEELFYVLFKVYRFDIAPHAITRRKEQLLCSLQNTPDMLVYTKQKEFLPNLTRLAETKLKEETMIDSIALHETITPTHEDICHYLQVCSNDRLKDFIYFQPFNEDIATVGEPISQHLLIQAVRREKTLNHVITQLTT